MGDQVVGQQLVAGLEYAGQGHPQSRGYGAVTVERQAVHIGHGRQKEVQQTASGERWSMRSCTKRPSIQDQPVAGGRRSRLGTRIRLVVMLGLLRVNNMKPTLKQPPGATR